jgi:ABC-type uncharacterized transport system substrate-binding protein
MQVFNNELYSKAINTVPLGLYDRRAYIDCNFMSSSSSFVIFKEIQKITGKTRTVHAP